MFPGEWISGAVCMYVASFLLENYEQSERVSSSTYIEVSFPSMTCAIKVHIVQYIATCIIMAEQQKAAIAC